MADAIDGTAPSQEKLEGVPSSDLKQDSAQGGDASESENSSEEDDKGPELIDSAQGVDASESENSSEEDDKGPELIDSLARCQFVCRKLMEESMVAVDMEGVDLGRHGEICIVQVATKRGDVFLFDVTTMGCAAFADGLKELLESQSVAKLLYDCRSDADALFHLHGIRLQHVLDLQVLCAKAVGSGSAYLCGMSRALGRILPYAEQQVMKGVKLAGACLFAPEKGGSFKVWKARPLPEVLLKYCSQDVTYLFNMLSCWDIYLPAATLRSISEERLRKRIDSADIDQSTQLALRDFHFPDEERPQKRPRQSA